MINFIIIYSYNDIYVEYFNDTEELRTRYYELLNKYRNNFDFHCKVFKISSHCKLLEIVFC